jgi:hypothetical protein
MQGAAIGPHLAAFGDGLERRFKAHTFAFGVVVENGIGGAGIIRLDMRRRFAGEPQRAAVARLRCGMDGAVERERQAHAAGSCGAEPDDDDLIRRGGERFPQIRGGADAVGDAHERRIEIQLAAVLYDVRGVIDADVQVAEHQVRFVVNTLHLAADAVGAHVIGLFEHQAPYLGKVLLRRGVVPLPRGAGPQRIFVELEALGGHTTKYHCAQASVADGQGVSPFAGGFVEPQHRLRRGGLRGGALESAGGKHCRG